MRVTHEPAGCANRSKISFAMLTFPTGLCSAGPREDLKFEPARAHFAHPPSLPNTSPRLDGPDSSSGIGPEVSAGRDQRIEASKAGSRDESMIVCQLIALALVTRCSQLAMRSRKICGSPVSPERCLTFIATTRMS